MSTNPITPLVWDLSLTLTGNFVTGIQITPPTNPTYGLNVIAETDRSGVQNTVKIKGPSTLPQAQIQLNFSLAASSTVLLRGEHFLTQTNRTTLYPVVVTNPNGYALTVQCLAGDGNLYSITVPASSISVVVNWQTAANNHLNLLLAAPGTMTAEVDPIIINDPTGH